ncbi:MAG: Tol-Pal system beta propeller repeat protein TolB [Nitrospinae bacterium RIFCSPLOWO2_02_FULL_39_110]|nr:MAG: Tol-Pal system beta propeller repeat protein TolB [Nitrospinae bacterium RIFCSPHIGHO2_12_FULL_39_42]OGV99159.1 MAG: Tol-Pal system beta propeller repeat protein TolB [Nitrospinae bacterium RIFCSPHIGHO2_02_39_11]OGW00734.1 MAG: Tol-Pal system beta propeller repeat protein TolB [Nitrospinae bacterium RIFCSPHIGHO2_02_FULL_39_82]OGW03932.1 MAG: Tol-Pal system beta propeller repeat protein TolB [Nitrospinae bacterium RIFCSPLOWO2_02_FULL_39_110]OGW06001.1 MAG: Tol-Pal system beta propeller re
MKDRKTEYRSQKPIFYLVFSILCFLSSILCPSFADTPDIYLSITRTGGSKIKIAIPDFSLQEGITDRENLSSKGAEILREDLEISGLFKTIDNKDILNEVDSKDKKSGKINFKEWASMGTEAIVKGHINVEEGKFNIECRLYDVKRGEQITGYKYSGDRTIFRQMIHKFSDEITYRFTGEKGIAMTMLAFVSKATENKEIYISDYDGHNIRKLTDHKSISLSPKWSPDGKSIVYTTFKYGNPDIYSINITNGKKTPVSTFSGMNMAGSWSPDGKRLAVSLGKDGNAEIYTMDMDGKNLSRLTNYRGIDTSPAWSPNGMEIAFTSDKSGNPQIYVMGSDGANLRRLTYQGSYNDQPSWSPDGNKIAYSSLNSGQFDIFVIDLVGNSFQQLTSGKGDNQNPSWSPDGRNIVFSSNRDGRYQIYIMKSDGAEQRKLIYIEGGGYSPSWSPRIE